MTKSRAFQMLISAAKQYLGQLEILGAFIRACCADLANLLAGVTADQSELASRINDTAGSARDRSKQLIAKLGRAPFKPLDEKTVRDLAVMQSEIFRGIARAGNRFMLYQIGDPGAYMPRISQKLLQQATLLEAVFAGIPRGDCVQGQCEEIIQLDKEVGKLAESGMLNLFETEKDPIGVIKKKQVLDDLGILAEKVRRIADFLRNLALIDAVETRVGSEWHCAGRPVPTNR